MSNQPEKSVCRTCGVPVLWAQEFGFHRPLEARPVEFRPGVPGAVYDKRRGRVRPSGSVWPAPKVHNPQHYCPEWYATRNVRTVGQVLAESETVP